jgi:hypothetical protein
MIMFIMVSPVFAILVILIFFPRKREVYIPLAFLALVVGGFMAWDISRWAGWDPACRSYYTGPPGDCFAVKLRTVLISFLVLEPFPIVAAVFRSFSLAAVHRGDLRAARVISGAGLAIVILGFAVLVGWGLQ